MSPQPFTPNSLLLTLSLPSYPLEKVEYPEWVYNFFDRQYQEKADRPISYTFANSHLPTTEPQNKNISYSVTELYFTRDFGPLI